MKRAKVKTPATIEEIFIDRLALTVNHLLDVLDYRPDDALKAHLVSSLDFIARNLDGQASLNRYYTVSTGEWSGTGNLPD